MLTLVSIGARRHVCQGWTLRAPKASVRANKTGKNHASGFWRPWARTYGTQFIESSKKSKRLVTSENRPVLVLPEGVEKSKRILNSAMKNWADLGLRLDAMFEALAELGLSEPTVIQQLVIPVLMQRGRQNLLFADQTGTGKTLAYLLPIIHALKQDELTLGRSEHIGRPKAIVLVPNRELADQVLKIAKKIGHHVKFRAVSISGGATVSQQRQIWESNIDLLIATPGRLLQHYDRKRLFFSKCQYVVLDEVDMLLDNTDGGFAKDCYRVIDAVRHRAEATDEDATFILCGATVTQTLLKEISTSFPNTQHILSPTLHKSVAKLEQHWITVAADKLAKLKEVLFHEYPRSKNGFENPKLQLDQVEPQSTTSKKSKNLSSGASTNPIKRTIIFCNTINSCRYLDHTLREAGFQTTSYHGEIPVDQRPLNFKSFAEGSTPILVCTDVASRGLDFVSVDHVILLDFPLNSIDYLHRIGRTARGGKSGKVTNFIMKRDFVLADAIRDALHRGHSLEGLTASEVENRQFQASKLLKSVNDTTMDRNETKFWSFVQKTSPERD